VSAPAGPIVVLEGVGKAFDGAPVLAGVDLAVGEGEFLAVLGPSGCGKTTLLRLVAGLDTPTAGRIGGRGLGPGEGGLAYVFQDPTLLPWASVFDNVRLPLRLSGMSREEARGRVLPLLATVGLSGREDAWPHMLSGGMRMRAALARALVTRPKLLLMDEPFAALDEITRHRLNDDLLRIVAETGSTVVFVTHSVVESAYLATRMVVMGDRPGRIVDDFPVDLPRLRQDALRRDPAYLAVCARASAALARAMGGEIPA
jgi:NitT/TauT family transport system ATP-binding protein